MYLLRSTMTTEPSISPVSPTPPRTFFPPSAFELDNRVRVAEMRISLTSNSHDGRHGRAGGRGSYRDGSGLRGGVSAPFQSRERKARSLSPSTRRGRGALAAVDAEAADMHARMAVIADATGTVG